MNPRSDPMIDARIERVRVWLVKRASGTRVTRDGLRYEFGKLPSSRLCTLIDRMVRAGILRKDGKDVVRL